jgi:hypothetical protein
MRYRQLDPNGDYTFGGGQADFYVNRPEAVAQAVGTRLRLDLGDWFLDTTDGMNWRTGVLGNRTSAIRDSLIRERILNTPGVLSITSYDSSFDGNTRQFRVAVALSTIYGPIPTPVVPAYARTVPDRLFFILDSRTQGRLDGPSVLD